MNEQVPPCDNNDPEVRKEDDRSLDQVRIALAMLGREAMTDTNIYKDTRYLSASYIFARLNKRMNTQS